jgi:thioredoxin 1
MKYLKTMEDYNAMLEESKDKLIAIDFTATWCGPCQFIGPIFEALSKEYPDVSFDKVDVDDASDIAEACGISAMPTFQFFKGGKKIDDFCGASKEKLVEKLDKHK